MLLRSTWTNDSDVIIVDDASEQNIEGEVSERFCVPVLRSPQPTGLSSHMNRCFALHRAWGYAAVVISNNDLVLPRGSLSEFTSLLLGEAPPHVKWLTLTTTLAGLGAPPSPAKEQLISHVYGARLPAQFRGEHIQIEETQAVQDAIMTLTRAEPGSLPRVLRIERRRPIGFFFGLRNLTMADGVTPVEQLLPATLVNLHQETYLLKHYRAYVAARAFAFHTKAATLPSGPNRQDILLCHRGGGSLNAT